LRPIAARCVPRARSCKGSNFLSNCLCFHGRQDPGSRFPHGMTADRPDSILCAYSSSRITETPWRPVRGRPRGRRCITALQIYLEQSGHVVFSARSKAEALREIPRANCHVLISDINLPDGNGWDLMQEVGKLCPDYAIAISGHGMKADRERSAESGFRHHLVKPISAQKLDTLLQEATTELKEKEK
jgi:CheY-like chemotaxis protein